MAMEVPDEIKKLKRRLDALEQYSEYALETERLMAYAGILQGIPDQEKWRGENEHWEAILMAVRLGIGAIAEVDAPEGYGEDEPEDEEEVD